jgi:hypothetical protein
MAESAWSRIITAGMTGADIIPRIEDWSPEIDFELVAPEETGLQCNTLVVHCASPHQPLAYLINCRRYGFNT